MRLAIIGLLLVALAGAFLFAGGWLTPDRLSPRRFVALLEDIGGHHPGFRRNHAKGVCVTGHFDGNGQGERLSKAALFHAGTVPVIGRFSIPGGDPRADDSSQGVRGLGLDFKAPGGQEWRTAMISLPVFPVHTPEEFYGLNLATRPDPKTGKPDPAAVKAFLGAHPRIAQTLESFQGHAPLGLAESTYNGLDAFFFTSAGGVTVPVRWSFVAEAAATAGPTPNDKGVLFEDLLRRLASGPLRWKLVVTVGRPDDPTDDASVPWPADREKVDCGTLVIERAVSDTDSLANDLNFDPLVLPEGITPSADPLLGARSAVYSRSFTKRAGEHRGEPDAIDPAAGRH